MRIQNTLTKKDIQYIREIQRSNKEFAQFVVEGKKCCYELLSSNYKISYVVVNKDNKDDKFISNLITKIIEKQIDIFEVSNSIFSKLSDTITPQGIIAVVEKKENDIVLNEPFIVLDNVSDPGNVGTIIRTADWFGIKQIILLENCAGKYSSKVVRATMGSLFRIKIKMLNYFQFKQLIDNKKIKLFGAFLDAEQDLRDIKIKQDEPFGLIVGNEAHGISKEIEEITTNKFKIKGSGQAESLNVGIALGISLFHFCNQKNS
ncbi:MAG: RNA methyltransferase [Bacteroidetes bacterium]|nr:RNA methyltransferase [Bacteroidota bacterium]